MTIVKQQALRELLARGAEKARRTSKSVLVSQLTEIPSLDPLSFFACGQTERFFWTDPGREVALAGNGAARRLTAEGEGSFPEVERQRQVLLEHAVIDADPAVPAGGPVFFGGFTFDPLKENSHLWKDFPNGGELTLPVFMLTVADGRSWLTTNAVIDQDTDPNGMAEQLIGKQERLMEASRQFEMMDEPEPVYTVTGTDTNEWKKAVRRAAGEIRDGLMEKVVFARKLEVGRQRPFSPSHVLMRLREQQPNSFLFAIGKKEHCFLGASPERLVKRTGDTFISTCLAGSIARGRTKAEDERLGEWLLNDRKNLVEHDVVVHMIKDAIGQVCPHVDVSGDPVLYKMRDIQHLYTSVVGKATHEASLLSVVERLHPTPALGGFPKKAALEKIREKEPESRGWYASPVGWIDYKGDGEFAVAIRSGLLQKNRASLFAGSGIVGDSDPDIEYRETEMKFRPMLSALGGVRA